MTGIRQRRQAGFTIVELLIATAVFSMVLILITVGVMSFTRSYYKGVNQSNTQAAARTVLEDIAQAIQFSGDVVTAPVPQSATGTPQSSGICVGSRRYSYLPGWQVTDGGANAALNRNAHALVMDTPGNCAGLPAQDLTASLAPGSVEMIPANMRLSKLKVERVGGATDVWQVTVRIVYGDNDLLSNPTGDNATCNASISGSQYCAQSELTTTVKKRIAQ